MPTKETVLRHFPFAVLLLATFYLLPLVETGDSGRLLLLLAFMPGLVFVISWFFGLVNRFRWYYFLAAGLLFLPAALIFFNATALWFCLIYAVLACLGSFLGGLWRRPSENTSDRRHPPKGKR